MPDTPMWEVTFFVYGPITVEHHIRLTTAKGDRYLDPFYSDVDITRTTSGIKATVTARASTNSLAYKAAMLFFGQMLDALTLHINQSMYLSLYERHSNHDETFTTKRRVAHNEWEQSFREARVLAFSEQTFFRTLGWYRKGLYTEDPFDKFLAFWNSIEIVASYYHPPIPEGKPSGSKSEIWESFKAIWGECKDWPNIPDETNWIDNNYATRLKVAHGKAPITVQEVESVADKFSLIEKVAYQFLGDWRSKKLEPKMPPDVELETYLFGNS